MVTDDERREVAAALRDEVGGGSSWPGIERLGLILGVEREPRSGWEGRILTRLADLIYQGDTSQGRRDIVACDREALLALAADMDLYARTAPYPSFGRRVATYARRIREALGVQDGD